MAWKSQGYFYTLSGWQSGLIRAPHFQPSGRPYTSGPFTKFNGYSVTSPLQLQNVAGAYTLSHGGRLRRDYQRQNKLGWRLSSAFQGHLRPHMCLCGQRSHKRLRSFADRDVFRKREESDDCPVQISTCPWMTITGMQPAKVQPSVPTVHLCEPAKV